MRLERRQASSLVLITRGEVVRIWARWWNGHDYDITYKDVETEGKAQGLAEWFKRTLGKDVETKITPDERLPEGW